MRSGNVANFPGKAQTKFRRGTAKVRLELHFGFHCGNKITSRMLSWPRSIMHRRSMPMPRLGLGIAETCFPTPKTSFGSRKTSRWICKTACGSCKSTSRFYKSALRFCKSLLQFCASAPRFGKTAFRIWPLIIRRLGCRPQFLVILRIYGAKIVISAEKPCYAAKLDAGKRSPATNLDGRRRRVLTDRREKQAVCQQILAKLNRTPMPS